MFSGKTEDLIRRLEAAEATGEAVQAFKPLMDTRYTADALVSHGGVRKAAQSVVHSTEILSAAKAGAVIGIDEAQFFDKGLPAVVEMLSRRGHRVILAGLDLDAAGEPFERTSALLKLSTQTTKLKAVCAQCGAPAEFTFRKAAGNSRIMLGAGESYEPRCASCFKEGIRSTFW